MWYNMAFNAEIIKYVQSFSNSFLDKFFILATMLGEETFFMIVVAIVLWCINKEFGYRLGFAYLSNVIINTFIKETLKIPRPIGEAGIRSLRVETADGYSFPSGHSQATASFWTSVMIKLRKKWFYPIGIIIVFLVAVSRLYLGVHRPVDVLVGMFIGTIWVFISNYMFDIACRTGKKSVFLFFIIPMVIIMFVIPNPVYYKVSGTVLAFYAGYIIEPKYINYEVNAELWKQVVKFITGFAVLMALRVLVKAVLPLSIISDFFRYFLIGIWVTVGAPFVFKRFTSGRNKNIDKEISA